MKLYRKYIRPMHCYPGQHYEPKTKVVEKDGKWYPEEERENLENKYDYLNKGSFSDLVFEEKYELYDDLAMLKEQETVKPTWSQGKAYCGKCGQRLPRKREDREINYCGYCGQEVNWK